MNGLAAESIRNLSFVKVSIVTYNFIPVLIWSRTEHDFTMSGCIIALFFPKNTFTGNCSG
ncbi:MAG: mannonate dehydratase [Lewinellaceae bacterium]|nr:mannonate dehydratase [Lewinellaceae bacterium]